MLITVAGQMPIGQMPTNKVGEWTNAHQEKILD